jgi:signal transduction histidine kinase
MNLASNESALIDIRYSRRLGLFLGCFAIIGGATTLAAWLFDVPLLASWGGTGIAMQPNTAIAAVLAGITVVLLSYGHSRVAACVGFMPLVVGASTLFQHASGIDLHIDTHLLLGREWGNAATTTPGRMGLPASVSYSLLGVGFVLSAFGPRVRRLSPALGIVVMGIVLFSLIGYLFDTSAFFMLPRLTAIALPTSLVLGALGLGLIMALHEHEPMRTLLEDTAAGLLARQSLPFVVILPIVVGFVRLKGEAAGLYDAGMGTSMLVVVLIVLLLGLLWHGVGAVRARENAQKAIEEALRQRELQLKDADRHKDEFIATLAHELRNPLAPISNALSILQHSNVEAAQLERTRDMMQRQVGHMVRLIDDLLDISRIGSGKLDLRVSPLDLSAVIHQAVETCRPLIDRGGHTLTVDLPREPIELQGDPIRLAQVFGNLIGNACKFTEPGGHIHVVAQHEGTDVMICVEDNGRGIPPDQLDRIFEIFAQVDRSTERSQGGLGIGLTLSKRLVELHGGNIAVTSEGLGRGSKFVVRLPSTPPTTDADHVIPFRRPGARRRILVVDDNRDNADSLAMLLALDGNETHIANDGEEAVTAAMKLRPDAVLLDLGLPKINGYEACRRIRAQSGGRKLAIYAITGWGQDSDRQRSREAGFDGHLVKPVDHEVLTRLLATI